MVLLGRVMQRCEPLLPRLVNVRAVGDKNLHGFGVSPLGSHMKRGLSIKALGVDRGDGGAVENIGLIHVIEDLLKCLHCF
jgi:hypothetical protein